MTETSSPDNASGGNEELLEKAKALKTVFYLAASKGDILMLRELLRAGVDAKYFHEAARCAAENGHAEATIFLLDGAASVVTAKDAFRDAVANGHVKTIRMIAEWLEAKGISNTPTRLVPNT